MEKTSPKDVNLNIEYQLPKSVTLPPDSGWKVRMNHKFSETWNQNLRPRLHQIPELLPLCIRYVASGHLCH